MHRHHKEAEVAILRAGIEIPIIPEDFIYTEEELHSDDWNSLPPDIHHTFPGRIDFQDWISLETFFFRYRLR
jgi:hypothetical protein